MSAVLACKLTSLEYSAKRIGAQSSLWTYGCVCKRCLRKYGKRVGESAMNVRWNDAGTLLLALRRSLSPIVFAVGQEEPLYEFYQPGYLNECTMKSCTFGGPNDRFVISGSDDFKVYIWEIPQSRSDGEYECHVGVIVSLAGEKIIF